MTIFEHNPIDVSAFSNETWFHYITSDTQILGFVGWIGLLVGCVSLPVTVLGFVYSIRQIKLVKSASDAASEAVADMANTVRAQEQSSKIGTAIDYLRSAEDQMRRENPDAASAYLYAGWNILIEARELSSADEHDTQLGDCIIVVRRVHDAVRSDARAVKVPKRYDEISSVLIELGTLSAKLRINLAGLRR